MIGKRVDDLLRRWNWMREAGSRDHLFHLSLRDGPCPKNLDGFCCGGRQQHSWLILQQYTGGAGGVGAGVVAAPSCPAPKPAPHVTHG